MKFDTTGIEDYVTNQTIESETGVWLKFPLGRRFLCLRAGGSNRRFTRAFQAAIKPHRRAMDKGTLDTEISDGLMRDVYLRTVILDWEGIKDVDGTVVSFNRENALALFAALPELFNDIVSLCSEMGTFQNQEIEEAKEVLGEA